MIRWTRRGISSIRNLSTTAKAGNKAHPTNAPKCPHPSLTKVPTLPFFGSLITSYSGTPPLDRNKIDVYFSEMRRRFGDFYSYGIPGFGAGIRGIVYAVSDPNEMMKVIRSEGTYPHGILENLWPIRYPWKNLRTDLVEGDDYGILSHGKRWKRHRVFFQTGMLDPKAVKGFVPGIVQAAEFASKGAPKYSENLNRYVNHCVFDMFNTFMFGELTRIADPDIDSDKENEEFCKAACGAFDYMITLNESPFELIMHHLGLETNMYKKYETSFATARRIGLKKVHSFIERYEQNDLNELEKASYLAHAIERRAVDGCDISDREMRELCVLGLFVSVDTTSALLSWLLVHLALNPAAQERLYLELSDAVAGKHIDEKVLSRKRSPFLHACVRESHRLTPSIPHAVPAKSSRTSDVDIHGVTLPKCSILQLNHLPKEYFEEADTFQPERWLREAVQGRAGTEKEVVDHPLFRDSFSAGARRCPGSRVATNEILAMISQLVLDWRITSSVESLDEVAYCQTPLITPYIPEMKFVPR